LSALADFYGQLEVSAYRTEARVEVMIWVAAELSKVQSRIEALDAERRSLGETVEADLVKVFF